MSDLILCTKRPAYDLLCYEVTLIKGQNFKCNLDGRTMRVSATRPYDFKPINFAVNRSIFVNPVQLEEITFLCRVGVVGKPPRFHVDR